jgi:type 1 fimbria pilin
MKQTVSLAVLALALLPAPALAQGTASGTVDIDGRVTPVCVLGDPNPALVNLGQISASSGPRTGRIDTIAPRNVLLPASHCNFAGSVVRVDATALRSSDLSAPQPGFTRAVNYTASASNWAAGTSTATTSALRDGTLPNASGTGAVQPLPKIADITLTLSNFTTPGDLVLVAGTYTGTVIVTLGPSAIPD